MTMKIYDVAFRDLNTLGPEEMSQLEQSRLSGSTLVVPQDSPALEVAKIVDETKSPQIVVTSSVGEIVGLIVTGVLRRRLVEHGKPVVASFYDALSDLINDPDEQSRQFHHEWLNFERPNDHWCSRGRHYTDEDPCSLHPPK